MQLEALLKQAQKKVVREVFGSDDLACEVELRLCSRRDMELMRRASIKKVIEKTPNGGRQMVDQVDTQILRRWLSEHCVTGWNGLTQGKAVRLCNAVLDGSITTGDVELPCNPENVRVLMESALGFEDWVWERVTRLAEEAEGDASRERPTSASISGDTIST